jgi:hypothetical protein
VRPYWKGYLKLALVSCPIALHAVWSRAERIAFRQVNKATGSRLRQQLIDEETLEPVAPEHKGRGYETALAPQGVTITTVVCSTGWQPHTAFCRYGTQEASRSISSITNNHPLR